LDLIKGWLASCEKEHEFCKAKFHRRDGKLPTRLIYVGASGTISSARLCQTSELPADTEYLTLSHCWGVEEIYKLLNDNLATFQKGLPLCKLQQTFVDALMLTNKLGFEYLWIDSLCIIQDSDEDWAKEAAKMGDIYANAFCTIAATGFPDGKSGIFLQRDAELLKPISITLEHDSSEESGIPSGVYTCMSDVWTEGIVKAPLSGRAWCFQERSLSRRIIHFGSKQIFWECMETEKCESCPAGIPAFMKTTYKKDNAFTTVDLKLRSGLRGTAWCDTISSYTAGSLTRDSDKLVAISGLAAKMIWSRPYKYYAGLWEDGFCYFLLWRTTERMRYTGGAKRPRTYRAPSWSWASVDGAIEFSDHRFATKELVQIIQVSTTPKDGQEFGEVSGGRICLNGYVFRVEFVDSDAVLNTPHNVGPHWMVAKARDSRKDLEFALSPFLDVYGGPTWDFAPSIHNSSTRQSLRTRHFFILIISSEAKEEGVVVYGLILQRTVVKGEYQRLGVFMIVVNPNHPELLFTHRPALDADDYLEHTESEVFSSTSVINIV
jgi:hypothetical protein